MRATGSSLQLAREYPLESPRFAGGSGDPDNRCGFDDQGHLLVIELCDRHICRRNGFAAERGIADVAGDADDPSRHDGAGQIVLAEKQLLANRIAVRKELARERLVDDHDTGRVEPVVARKGPAPDQWYPQRVEELRRDCPPGAYRVKRPVERPARHDERQKALILERHAAEAGRGGRHARLPAHAVDALVHDSGNPGGGGESGLRQRRAQAE
jgi:hypothetical protein